MPAPSWIQSLRPDDEGSYGARNQSTLSDEEKRFVRDRDLAETIAEVADPYADYSYNSWALCSLDGCYYVFNTSGCSCPSPSETWELVLWGGHSKVLDWLNEKNEACHKQAEESGEDTYLRDMSAGGVMSELLRAVWAAGWVLDRAPLPAPSATAPAVNW